MCDARIRTYDDDDDDDDDDARERGVDARWRDGATGRDGGVAREQGADDGGVRDGRCDVRCARGRCVCDDGDDDDDDDDDDDGVVMCVCVV